MSDSGSSCDSWSSTHQQVRGDHHQYLEYQHQYQVYHWPPQHARQQVETNQSTCRQLLPHCSQAFHYVNQRRPDVHHQQQYRRNTSRAHRYYQHRFTQQPSACSPCQVQFNSPAQLIAQRQAGARLGNSGSTWIDTDQQHVATSYGLTHSQLETTSQTPVHCYQWNDSSHTSMQVTQDMQQQQQQQQQQHASIFISNTPNILPSHQWFAEPSYDNSINDAEPYELHQL